MTKLAFGSTARDSVTKFTGIITAKAEYDTGCTRYQLTPTVDGEGKLREAEWFDEPRLGGVDVGPGGPQPSPKQNADPA